MTVSKDDSEYKMYHKYRGIAVILNHETFDMEGIPVRKGTEKDVKALKTSLKKLGFRVHIYNDLTDTGIVAVLKKGEINQSCSCRKYTKTPLFDYFASRFSKVCVLIVH